MKKLLYLLLPIFATSAAAQQPYVSSGPPGGQARALHASGGRTLAGGRGNLYERQSGAWAALTQTWSADFSCEAVTSIYANPSGIIAGTLNAGVFFSNDNGQSWSNITGDLRTGTPYRSVVYAMPFYIVVRSDGAMFQSSDGITWAPRNTAISNSAVGYLSVGMNDIYVTTNNGLFRSVDNGVSYMPQNPGSGLDGKMLWVNDTLWVAGSNGLRMSTDNGNSFDPPMLSGRAVGSVAVIGSNILATVAGASRVDSVLYSSNGGASFTTVLPNGSFRFSTVYDIVSDGNGFVVGTDQGILHANANNTGWRRDDSGFHARQITHLGNGGGMVYATANGEGVFNTADSGASWTPGASASTGAENNINATDGYNQFAYAAGATNFYRSTNNGASYTAGATGLGAGAYTSVCVQKSSGSVLVVHNGELFRSGDNGVTFAQVVTGIPAGIARRIYHADTSWFIAAANDSLYQAGSNLRFQTAANIQGNGLNGVAFRQQYYASHDRLGLFSSTDGKTWTTVSDPAIPLTLHAIAEADTAIYLGTNNGLVSNKGGSWHADSLQGRIVNALMSVNRKLYAGTCDGVWTRRNLPPPVDTNLGVWNPGNGIAGLQLYPNPAGGDFNATFGCSESGIATLTMTDVAGRSIYSAAVVVTNGVNTVPVPVSGFKPAPGLYFIKIQTASAQGVRRILIQ